MEIKMSILHIDKKLVGWDCVPFLIAEAGINHNGDIRLAKEMVLAAKEAKVDAIKFQTFYAKEFIQDRTLLYTYQSQGREVTEPIFDLFHRVEFSREEWREIKEFCDENEILFLSTPGNVSDLELLLSLDVAAVKVGSDDFVNIPLIRRYAKEKAPLLLSCGMAKEEEIDLTLKTAGYGNQKELCLFLCTSQYPTPPEDVNILKLTTLHKKYPDLVLGLSDHTKGSTAAIMAVASGASIFEKHFTLDHHLSGPDHWFSEEPKSLRKWAEDIYEAHRMLGSGILSPTKTEEQQRREFHRSITTARRISAGETFTEDNLCMRRPGDGLPASMWDEVIGKRAKRNLEANIQFSWEDII
jgi:sialic acid synthase SpsE